MISPKRIEARDRRLAAVHEAGHAVMARCHLRISAKAFIWKVKNPAEYEKTWIGKTYFARISNKHNNGLLALAGPIAEFIWKGLAFDDVDWGDPDIMSSTDWAGCGCKPGRLTNGALKKGERVYSLLTTTGDLWPRVICESRQLIKESGPLGPLNVQGRPFAFWTG